jgi:spermidine/putrescine transport system permease protein
MKTANPPAVGHKTGIGAAAGRIAENIYLVIILVFLYIPIVTMIALSFNASKSRAVWGGFTLSWYAELFSDAEIMGAFRNTMVIALLSAVIATILGTAAAIGINSMRKLPRTICMGVTNIPMLNADIVTGISLMLAFIAFRISLGFQTILIAHITFNIPYVILSVMPKLKQTSRYAYEAAQDLGATPRQAFFRVVFPDIRSGITSGFLLAFTMSLDDFIITYFTRGAGIDTLSTLIYSQVRRGIVPSMYALSAIIFIAVLVLLLLANFMPRKKAAESKAEPAVPQPAAGDQA